MKRQNKPHRRYNKVLLSAFALFLIIAVLLLASKKPATDTPPPAETPVAADVEEPADASSEVSGRWYGLCGKNTVGSVDDFQRVVRKDPVLAAHYAGFDWANARMAKLEKPLPAYVSYRKDGAVQSPTKRITLPRGDRYITDGTSLVRTYCCNDFAAAPPVREKVEQTVLPEEIVAGPPVQISYDPPIQRSAGPVRLALAEYPHFAAPLAAPPPPLPPLPPPPPPPVPEPGTLTLMVTGIAALGVARWLSRKGK